MTRFVVDSWAWLEYLNGTGSGQKLRNLIDKEGNEVFTSIISYSEVISVAKRKNMDVDIAENALATFSEIVDIDKNMARETALFHGEIRKKINDFGLGDAFVVVTANKLNAKIVTGDPHFKDMKNVLMI